jgi:tetratricopeptide (TPR) repeat protein
MARGDYTGALDYFHRAEALTPNYYILEINLGVANGAIRNNAEAEKHFMRAIQLAPMEAEPRYYLARWLRDNGRLQEAAANLRFAVRQNPTHIESQYLLMRTDADMLDADDLRTTAQQTLAQFPSDGVAAGWLARAASPTPEAYLNQSLAAYQAGRYADCIAAAQKALQLRPGYSEAWNNIAAAWNAQGKFDEGIRAGEEAVRLNPNSQLAKNNLAWARSQKQRLK